MFHITVPSAVALTLGPLTIYWYGIIMATAIGVALTMAGRLARQQKLSVDHMYNMAVVTVIAGLLGARLYHVLVHWSDYVGNMGEIVAIWHGGLAIHGALIGGLVAIVAYSRWYKLPLWRYTDVVAMTLPLAQAIGRWGNYFNQELFGRPTSLPWGIPIEEAYRPVEYVFATHFHPLFLYESILNLVSFGLMWVWWRLSGKQHWSAGRLTALYIVHYGVIRAVMELQRIEPTAMIGDVRWPFVVSVVLVVGGIVVVVSARAGSAFGGRSQKIGDRESKMQEPSSK